MEGDELSEDPFGIYLGFIIACTDTVVGLLPHLLQKPILKLL